MSRTWRDRHRISDETADDGHYQHGDDENAVGGALNSVSPPKTASAQSGIGKQTRSEKQERVTGKKVVGQSISFAEGNDDANQSDHCQTNAHHRRGDSEDVNADVFFEFFSVVVRGHSSLDSSLRSALVLKLRDLYFANAAWAAARRAMGTRNGLQLT